MDSIVCLFKVFFYWIAICPNQIEFKAKFSIVFAGLSVRLFIMIIRLSGVSNHKSDLQNQTNEKRESDLLITSVITDRFGRHTCNVLLPINHNHYNFPQK